MRIVEKRMQEVDVLVDVKCDICGESCATDCGPEFATLSATWGYSSHKDGETWEAHICERCCDALSFVNKIRRRDYHPFTGEGMGEWRTGDVEVER